MSGPLRGLRIVEFEGIGPAPYAAMLLADQGADVVRVARPRAERGALLEDIGGAVLHRGRESVTLDLKDDEDRAFALRLMAVADGVIEGLRPGVMERLGLGPDAARAVNPRLVYGRVTGWGQSGPLARSPGHDINYIALSGTLGSLRPNDGIPQPPLNLVGDFGGGGLWLAFGMMAALWEARQTGRGQVVDAAMVDGAASQLAMVYAWLASGAWSRDGGANLLDGSAPFYRCYACADGRYVAVGALEPKFFEALMEGLGLAEEEGWSQEDRTRWPDLAERIAGIFATRPRDDWAEIFAGSAACVTPVLSPSEAPNHPHNRARRAFTGVPVQPAPGPRMSNHERLGRHADPRPADRADVIARWKLDRAGAAGD